MACSETSEIELTEEQLEIIAASFGSETAERMANIKFVKFSGVIGIDLLN